MSNITKYYKDLSDSEQSGVIQEFQENYYHHHTIETIHEAFTFVNPIVRNEGGKNFIAESYKNPLQIKLNELKEVHTKSELSEYRTMLEQWQTIDARSLTAVLSIAELHLKTRNLLLKYTTKDTRLPNA